MSQDILAALKEALAELKMDDAARLTGEAVSSGIPATTILLEALSPGMAEVGRRFEEKEYFLAELLFAAHIMGRCTETLKPLLEKEVQATPAAGRVLLGTVEGDVHDIGKNIVASFLRAAGFEVHDIGVDVPSSRFAEKTRELRPDILGLSALLSNTAPEYKRVVDAVKGVGLRQGLYIMIGGPVASTEYAREVGADIYCKDAVEAVRVAKEYMGKKRATSPS